MKTNPDQNRDDALLDAVLGGEPWAEVRTAGKRAALAEFHARQRRRRVRFWAMQAAACAVFAGGVVWMSQRASIAEKPNNFAVVAPTQIQNVAEIQNSIKRNPPDEMAMTHTPEPSSVAVMPGPSLVADPLPIAPQDSPDKISAPTTPTSPAPAAADLANLPQYITEQQMLALFPKGSCIIAEIDGQKQLIFFDRKIEKEGAPYQPGS